MEIRTSPRIEHRHEGMFYRHRFLNFVLEYAIKTIQEGQKWMGHITFLVYTDNLMD